jgi:hypothetical protein
MQLTDKYALKLANYIKFKKMDRACDIWGDVYKVLVGKHEAKRPLGRPRHKW